MDPDMISYMKSVSKKEGKGAAIGMEVSTDSPSSLLKDSMANFNKYICARGIYHVPWIMNGSIEIVYRYFDAVTQFVSGLSIRYPFQVSTVY